MIFVNLPVRDLESSKRFFSSLGFGFDARFSDDKAACLVIDDGHSYVMLLVEEFFRTFITTDIADTAHATEVLTCLSCASRDEVDELVAKAIAAGGKPWKPVMDEGPMHGGSFQDIDGHVWEVLHMDPSGIPAA
ncbi:MAG: VOC family protein [Frankiaceae bacterium]